MYDDDSLIPIAALQHYCYCPRQCALIHLEQAWEENQHTAAGQVLHKKTHEPATAMENGVLVARGVRLCSMTLGLTGQADTVEFHPAQPSDIDAVQLANRSGRWRVQPVEYKKGGPKKNSADRVQLCAQALCLEEMLNTHIEVGILFYGRIRRRVEVMLDNQLREKTIGVISQTRDLIMSSLPQNLPAPCNDARCRLCSLAELCQPNLRKSAKKYFDDTINLLLCDGGQP
ncbi:MAG TPA: CRISPR-associated protein Cas4 [Phycisphaerae bacterium]|nr:CRISPR-associated protein Cas4 [Phycisphaerae bacterium]